MTTSSWSYPDWKAPADDGALVIWPDPDQLLADTRENFARLRAAHDVLIQNTPLPTLRSQMRAFLNHDDDQPMIATGHQTELYHAGVWVKDVLIDRAAMKLNGEAFHIAVDTDSPKHLNLRWPDFSMPITDDPAIASAAWTGRLAPPSPRHVQSLDRAAREAFSSFGFEPPLPAFLESLRRLSLESDDLPSMLTNAHHQLDWSLGLKHHAMTVSPMLRSMPYLAFVHHLMSRPFEFARSYNAALADYRKQEGIKSIMRPMPDLFTSELSVETPFWLDDLSSGTRRRPSVFKCNDCGDDWVIQLAGGEEFRFDPSRDATTAAEMLLRFLAQTNHRLSPRALTLTLFLRLFVADQFVHGIGGARYDQVTDRLIASFFKLAPPKFSVTTATLFFPGAVDQPRVCLPCVKQEGHQLKHAVLGRRKREMVSRIASLPRYSRQRQEAFAALHRERRAALATSPAIHEWEQRHLETETREQREAVLFDRELSYTVQSRDRLNMLIDKYTEAFNGAAGG